MNTQDDKTTKSSTFYPPTSDKHLLFTPDKKEEDATPATKKPAKTDDLKARILTAMSVTFPASRDAEVQEVHSVSGGLSVAEVAYSPSTDTSAETAVLVFDNGKSVYLWPCQ